MSGIALTSQTPHTYHAYLKSREPASRELPARRALPSVRRLCGENFCFYTPHGGQRYFCRTLRRSTNVTRALGTRQRLPPDRGLKLRPHRFMKPHSQTKSRGFRSSVLSLRTRLNATMKIKKSAPLLKIVCPFFFSASVIGVCVPSLFINTVYISTPPQKSVLILLTLPIPAAAWCTSPSHASLTAPKNVASPSRDTLAYWRGISSSIRSPASSLTIPPV